MKHIACALFCAGFAASAIAAETTVVLHQVDAQGIGKEIGSVKLVDTQYGLVFYPSLSGLAPGLHGFHVHENPSCAPAEKDGKPGAALAAGGHFDPDGSKKHDEPWGNGHKGDLPPLFVTADGHANQPVLASRLKAADIKNRALMVHVGGDNHSDQPEPLGGGGARMACGVIGG